MNKPLCIDLFCGLGGWTDGFLAEGYECIGFDIERHDYGTGGYPAQLVLQDVLTLHGSQFRNAAVIVASPPCQAYSYRAMPWNPLWLQNSCLDDDGSPPIDHRIPNAISNELFRGVFRIRQEACEAAGRFIPLVVENVKGAQKWVGRAAWHFGSFYLWGDVPALMPPSSMIRKNSGGSWFAEAHNTTSGHSQNPDGRKIPGQDWSRFAKTGEVSPHWNQQIQGLKVPSDSGRRMDKGKGARFTTRDCGLEGVKQRGSGAEWFDLGIAKLPSGSNRRKIASAQIAKIPLPLSQYIARTYKPEEIAA